MHVVIFSLKDLALNKMYVILRKMETARGGSGGVLTLPNIPGRPDTDYGIVFADSVDFIDFKRHLQERQVPFSEPGDLPTQIKESFQYEIFLRLCGPS